MVKNEQSVMTDDQIEEFIYSEIKRKGITFYDMIGGVGGVEPEPNNKKMGTHKSVRHAACRNSIGLHHKSTEYKS